MTKVNMLFRLYIFSTITFLFLSSQQTKAQTNPTQLYDLMGMVYMDSIPSHAFSQYVCEAELYEFVDSLGEYRYSASAAINYNTGQYTFADIKSGRYLVKSSTSNSLDYFPTYYPDHAVWSDAQEVTIVNSSVFTANVFLSPVTYVGYDGASISGNILNQVDSSNASSVVVYLMDTLRNPLLFSVSDSLGNYSFDNLDYGHYLIHAEVLNKVSDELEVILSPQNAFPSINFNIGEESVTPMVLSFTKDFEGDLSVFPNPFNKDLTIDLKEISGKVVNVDVLDVLGKHVFSSQGETQSGSYYQNISLDGLRTGVYSVMIRIDNKTTVVKRVIKVD